MTIPTLGVFLGLLFLVICYQQYKISSLSNKIKVAQTSANLDYAMVMGLGEILKQKKLISDEEIIQYSLTGKIAKADDTKATV